MMKLSCLLCFLKFVILLNLTKISTFQEVRPGYKYVGLNIGSFEGDKDDTEIQISGQIFVVDDKTIFVQNFLFEGTDKGCFIYAGTLNEDGGYTKTGYPLTNPMGNVEALRPYAIEGRDKTFHFPSGKHLSEVDWIGIVSRSKKVVYSRIDITDEIKEQIPRPHILQERFLGRKGLSSGNIMIVDSKTIAIREFNFRGLAPETYFWVGRGKVPSENGVAIANERGSKNPLTRYRNKTVILTLPDGMDVFSVDYLSIWSRGLKRSLAYITIPKENELNVPPSLDRIGIKPEMKLNCETLDADTGYELRWSVIGDSIIFQMVSNTGTERYLAFGILNDKDVIKRIRGDAVVGWINSKSGNGGVDDYFLAGETIKCTDEAESCPDISKEGGSKNVNLLNSVSRGNYTMLTFRRPLIGKDQFDTEIKTNRPQNIIWSIGHKKAEMRKKYKPLKNKGDISIDFGRNPIWNCKAEDKSEKSEADVTNSRYKKSKIHQKIKINQKSKEINKQHDNKRGSFSKYKRRQLRPRKDSENRVKCRRTKRETKRRPLDHDAGDMPTFEHFPVSPSKMQRRYLEQDAESGSNQHIQSVYKLVSNDESKEDEIDDSDNMCDDEELEEKIVEEQINSQKRNWRAKSENEESMTLGDNIDVSESSHKGFSEKSLASSDEGFMETNLKTRRWRRRRPDLADRKTQLKSRKPLKSFKESQNNDEISTSYHNVQKNMMEKRFGVNSDNISFKKEKTKFSLRNKKIKTVDDEYKIGHLANPSFERINSPRRQIISKPDQLVVKNGGAETKWRHRQVSHPRHVNNDAADLVSYTGSAHNVPPTMPPPGTDSVLPHYMNMPKHISSPNFTKNKKIDRRKNIRGSVEEEEKEIPHQNAFHQFISPIKKLFTTKWFGASPQQEVRRRTTLPKRTDDQRYYAGQKNNIKSSENGKIFIDRRYLQVQAPVKNIKKRKFSGRINAESHKKSQLVAGYLNDISTPDPMPVFDRQASLDERPLVYRRPVERRQPLGYSHRRGKLGGNKSRQLKEPVAMALKSKEENVKHEEVTVVYNHSRQENQLKSEMDFVPIRSNRNDYSSVGNIPLLAFSVHEKDSHQPRRVLQDIPQKNMLSLGDRGKVLVDVPTAKVAYVPNKSINSVSWNNHLKGSNIIDKSVPKDLQNLLPHVYSTTSVDFSDFISVHNTDSTSLNETQSDSIYVSHIPDPINVRNDPDDSQYFMNSEINEKNQKLDFRRPGTVSDIVTSSFDHQGDNVSSSIDSALNGVVVGYSYKYTK